MWPSLAPPPPALSICRIIPCFVSQSQQSAEIIVHMWTARLDSIQSARSNGPVHRYMGCRSNSAYNQLLNTLTI